MDKLLHHLNQSPYVFYFLVVDNSLDIELYPKLKNFHLVFAQKSPSQSHLKSISAPYFCLKDNLGSLRVNNTAALLSHPQVINYISTTSKNLTPVIIPFKPSPKIDLICGQNNWLLAANPGLQNRLLEDKINFYHISQKLNLPVVSTYIDQFSASTFQKYFRLFSGNLIIQTRHGWAGKSTFRFSSYSQAQKVILDGTEVKFCRYVDGFTLINNCCLTRLGLLQSPPALQYTGLKPFTHNPFTTVGRQWPSYAHADVILRIKDITQSLGDYLKTLNYRGFFGLDFLVSSNHVFLLECNPRLTASFAFYTRLESAVSLTPLFLFHLAEFCNLKFDFDLDREQKRFSDSQIVGTEITPKNASGATLKKFHFDQALSLCPDPVQIDSEIINRLVR